MSKTSISGAATSTPTRVRCGLTAPGSRSWAEPSVSFAYTLPTASGTKGSTLYGSVSAIGTGTLGGGDAVAGTSTTSFEPGYVALENLFVGWKSGGLLPALGDDAIDISAGNQPLTIGDGLLISGGVFNAYQRAAYYTSPRAAFDRTAMLKFNPSALAPLRATVFELESVTDQSLLNGLDQPATSLAGTSIDWYGEPRKDKLGTLAEQWVVTGTWFNVYSADQAAPGSILANRNGLNVYSARLAGSFLPFDRDALLFGEYVAEINNTPGRQTNANGWYIEPGYQFSTLPWAPIVTYRHASFSGDGDPTGGGTKNSYDPLFFGAGGRGLGPGTWYIGEIYGWYEQGLTNITVNQVTLRASPTDQINVGANYYRIDFNKLGQVNQLISTGAPVSSKRAMDELDLYMEWSPTAWLTVVPTMAVGVPGPGYKQVDTGTGRAGGATIFLAQAVATVKF